MRGIMTNFTIEDTVSYLTQNRIFKDVDKKAIASVLTEHCTLMRYKKGDTVLSTDTPQRQLCLIIKGEARVSKGETVISHLNEGDIYGAAYLYNSSCFFENTVTAVTPLKVAIIEKEGVDRIIENDKTAAFNFIAYLSERVSFLNSKIEDYTQPTAEEKLLLYLEKNCETTSGKYEITVSMTELSDVLRISRASLYRVIEALEKSGKIVRNGKKIYLQKS